MKPQNLILGLLFICLYCITPSLCYGDFNAFADTPVLYKGRYRPMEAYARLWLYERYHQQAIAPNDLAAFKLRSSAALELLWLTHFLGYQRIENSPLYWISHSDVKKAIGLDLQKDRFSLNELASMLKAPTPELEGTALEEWLRVKQMLESDIRMEAPTLDMLPAKIHPEQWLDIRYAFQQGGKNPTFFHDELFEHMRDSYIALAAAVKEDSPEVRQKALILSHALQIGYIPLENVPYLRAIGKTLSFPSSFQLYIERLYYQLPLIWLSAVFYILATALLLFSLTRLGLTVLAIAFMVHSLLLTCRCYLLQRPPVSNMFETAIYVPWFAVLIGTLLFIFLKNRSSLLAASFLSACFLVFIEIFPFNHALDNIAPVLNSHYWLVTHVLMVVGSYGAFLLAAVLGHGYLLLHRSHKHTTQLMTSLTTLIEQSIYIGLTMLITGTILGGVWAAESWGRFWDWDPKESWAFATVCVYLVFIHAFRCHKITSFGLAVGSIVGFIAASFTWYGVNYILGTGLHSYGFGQGGESLYYGFLVAEAFFLITLQVLIKCR